MATELDALLPELKEFSIPDVPFKVVDPVELPNQTRKAFDEFMTDASTPAAFCVYSHDYSRFCHMVRSGEITIE
ncbi:hypothetical protein C942_00205 [Photobacterium marinum]|uniref:Uncharacterized protein n=1 Tax=Photobacterium marinum TaxID=1056511 RepID=L8JKD7_9GAMM|nr:hypothetical protein [Photobacterium marinum]ELR67897.1 hypothetical protein C942_00205 [Photobacterium marinum]